jgi:hypothetical protein
MAMANNTPEGVDVSLCSALMGGLSDEWDLDEEEVVQLWLVLAKGQVCGGPVGSMMKGQFCVEEASTETGACDGIMVG